jgi:hypothetical protein
LSRRRGLRRPAGFAVSHLLERGAGWGSASTSNAPPAATSAQPLVAVICPCAQMHRRLREDDPLRLSPSWLQDVRELPREGSGAGASRCLGQRLRLATITVYWIPDHTPWFSLSRRSASEREDFGKPGHSARAWSRRGFGPVAWELPQARLGPKRKQRPSSCVGRGRTDAQANKAPASKDRDERHAMG